jgi:hypothetical protein
MKGEQPKPDIKPSGKKPNVDISSEEERKPKNTPKNKKSKTKKDKIMIDRVVVCEVDKDILPDDAVFKGYQDVVVQEIKIITDNIEYRKEIYYTRVLGQFQYPYRSIYTFPRILAKNKELFHREKADIFRAGLLSTSYQQMDDTSSRVHSQNHYAIESFVTHSTPLTSQLRERIV